MRLDVKRFALAGGVLCGLAILIVTVVATARGIGNQLSHLSALYLGYDVSYLGSLVGLLYGFVSGAIAGIIFAAIYNTGLPTKT